MKFIIFYLVATSLFISSLSEDNTKLKDVLKKSKSNNTKDFDENDDVLRREILNVKSQCSGNNSNSSESNNSKYDQNYQSNNQKYGENHGRYNRNDQVDYQAYGGYSSNSDNRKGYSNSDINSNQGSSSNSGYGYNNNDYNSKDSNNNGYSTGNSAYYTGMNPNGNSERNFNDNSKNDYNQYDTRNQNGYYGIRNSQNENCQNRLKNAGRVYTSNNNQNSDYGLTSHGQSTDITGYYNGRRITRSDNMYREDKYSFQCTSQCIFGHLKMLDDDQVPSETLFVKWIQENIKNDDLKRIQTLREVRKCFARMATSDIEDGCDFSKELSNCLNLELEK